MSTNAENKLDLELLKLRDEVLKTQQNLVQLITEFRMLEGKFFHEITKINETLSELKQNKE